MAPIKHVALAKKTPKEVTLDDNVLDMSITIGLKGVDVDKGDIVKLDRLLHDHYMAGMVALERGDTENWLYFRMVCKARVKSLLSFGILTRKYMVGMR